MSKDKKPNRIPIPLLFIGGLFLVIGLWAGWFFHLKAEWLDSATKMPIYGVFGDSFGSLNTLFAGLAFVGVIVTLYKQHVDGIDADERHDENIKSQERITELQALIACLNFERSEYEAGLSLAEKLYSMEHSLLTTLAGYDNYEENFETLTSRLRGGTEFAIAAFLLMGMSPKTPCRLAFPEIGRKLPARLKAVREEIDVRKANIDKFQRQIAASSGISLSEVAKSSAPLNAE